MKLNKQTPVPSKDGLSPIVKVKAVTRRLGKGFVKEMSFKSGVKGRGSEQLVFLFTWFILSGKFDF